MSDMVFSRGNVNSLLYCTIFFQFSLNSCMHVHNISMIHEGERKEDNCIYIAKCCSPCKKIEN